MLLDGSHIGIFTYAQIGSVDIYLNTFDLLSHSLINLEILRDYMRVMISSLNLFSEKRMFHCISLGRITIKNMGF